MKKFILLLLISPVLVIQTNAQSWDQDDVYDNPNRGGQQNRNQGWNQQSQNGWNQQSQNGRNQGWDNPYQDPNYYPMDYGHRGCPPPPVPPCRRNIVLVTPPPSYCAPVVIAPMPHSYYRPYGYNPYRRPYGFGFRSRGWRGR